MISGEHSFSTVPRRVMTWIVETRCESYARRPITLTLCTSCIVFFFFSLLLHMFACRKMHGKENYISFSLFFEEKFQFQVYI